MIGCFASRDPECHIWLGGGNWWWLGSGERDLCCYGNDVSGCYTNRGLQSRPVNSTASLAGSGYTTPERRARHNFYDGWFQVTWNQLYSANKMRITMRGKSFEEHIFWNTMPSLRMNLLFIKNILAILYMTNVMLSACLRFTISILLHYQLISKSLVMTC